MKFLLLVLLAISAAVASAADFAGTWDVEVMADSQTHEAKLRFTAEEDKVSGVVIARGKEMPMKAVKAENDTVTFQVDADDHTVTFALKISGASIEGKWEVDGNGGPVKGKKQP